MSLVAQTESPRIDELTPECREQVEILAMQLGITQDETIERAIRELWVDRSASPPITLA